MKKMLEGRLKSLIGSFKARYVCIKLRVVSGSGNGVAELFVNGQSVLSSSTQTINPIRYLYAGSIWSGTSCTANIDSFVANTSYIGT
jgi:hypothetical protein